MTQRFEIDTQLYGYPGLAYGGYVAGVLASRFAPVGGEATRVGIRGATPLGSPLEVESHDRGLALVSGGDTVAEASRSGLELAELAVEPVSLETAKAARSRYPGHGFRADSDLAAASVKGQCFGCGATRSEGEGLRIFPGYVAKRDLVAAIWTPHHNFASNGVIRPEFTWAAMDCPGAWALLSTAKAPGVCTEKELSALSYVLARMEGGVTGDVVSGEPYVVMAWVHRLRKRTFVARATVFDARGDLCAATQQLWVKAALEHTS